MEHQDKIFITSRNNSPSENLRRLLAPFETPKGYPFEALKRATETRDQWGALLGVPNLDELQALDQDGDKIVTISELRSFRGLQNRFCKTIGESSNGLECKERCHEGHDSFDGNFAYFAGTQTRSYHFSEESYKFRDVIDRYDSGAITAAQKRAIGMGLFEIVKAGNVDGAVCELGVFTGLPDCDKKEDGGMCGPGSMSVPEVQVKHAFLSQGLPVPPMHKGFFSDIPDSEFPEKIAFAFIDADLYPSMMSGLQKVWPRVSKGGVVFLHDYAWEGYPGTEHAANDFLADKVEKVQLPGGPDGVACHLGYLRKL